LKLNLKKDLENGCEREDDYSDDLNLFLVKGESQNLRQIPFKVRAILAKIIY